MNALESFMDQDLRRTPLPPGLEPLAAEIRRRYPGACRALVLYGSWLRNGGDGLADLLLVVDSYRRAHRRLAARMLNRALPPNVYYLELPGDAPGEIPGEAAGRDGPLRCKFAVISECAFRRRCRAGLDGYFWARFSQPARLVWAKDEAASAMVAAGRADAAVRFAAEAAPLARGEFDAGGFWREAMASSYRCELRPESLVAARALVDTDPAYWARLGELVLSQLPGIRRVSPATWTFSGSALSRLRASWRWGLRRVWGKTLNLLRLLKAAGTFSNGIDYLLWKVERHSGVRMEATERMRRHPRLAAWGLAVKLWREGAFR